MSRRKAKIVCWCEPVGDGLVAANCSIYYTEYGCIYRTASFVVLSKDDFQWRIKARQRLTQYLMDNWGGRVPMQTD